MNTDHIKIAAQAGAEAASAKLKEIDSGEDLLTVGTEMAGDFQTDMPAREAFATAAITRYLELQSADVPSVEELKHISWAASREYERGGAQESNSWITVVRTAIVTAYEAKLANWERALEIANRSADEQMRYKREAEATLALENALTETRVENQVMTRDLDITRDNLAKSEAKLSAADEQNKRQADDLEDIQRRLGVFDNPTKSTSVIKQAETAANSKIIDLNETIQKLEGRLAELEWRPISVKPTREDADCEGRVITTCGKRIWYNEYDSLSSAASHWRPAALPAVVDKERVAFEKTLNAIFGSVFPWRLEEDDEVQSKLYQLWQAAKSHK